MKYWGRRTIVLAILLALVIAFYFLLLINVDKPVNEFNFSIAIAFLTGLLTTLVSFFFGSFISDPEHKEFNDNIKHFNENLADFTDNAKLCKRTGNILVEKVQKIGNAEICSYVKERNILATEETVRETPLFATMRHVIDCKEEITFFHIVAHKLHRWTHEPFRDLFIEFVKYVNDRNGKVRIIILKENGEAAKRKEKLSGQPDIHEKIMETKYSLEDLLLLPNVELRQSENFDINYVLAVTNKFMHVVPYFNTHVDAAPWGARFTICNESEVFTNEVGRDFDALWQQLR